MSDYKQKDGHFTVWKNEKWEKGANAPYAQGKGTDLNGNEVEVSLWIPKSDKVKGFNLKMQPPYKKENTQQEEQKGINAENDNDLPF